MARLRHRRALSLVELLVTVAIITVLLAVLIPSLAAVRRAATGVQCTANLRQVASASLLYAQDQRGSSPALGVPWGRPPFWALVVLRQAGGTGDSAALYDERSILVCRAAALRYGTELTRTYAVNVTGHAGRPGDASNFDAEFAHIRLDALVRPAELPWYFDSAITDQVTDGPPPTRTISTIDFRDPLHVNTRVHRRHGSREDLFNVAHFDGSAGPAQNVPDRWREPLP